VKNRPFVILMAVAFAAAGSRPAAAQAPGPSTRPSAPRGRSAAPASRPATRPVAPTRKLRLAGRENRPRIELSSHLWDFGRLWFGDPCSTQVRIRNAGTAPLKILAVKSSCGCTVARLKKRTLAPGESVAMTVTYNTRKNVKKVRQRIMIRTNDPAQPTAVLDVRGEVWHVYDGHPVPRIVFGQVQPDTVLTESIELTCNMDKPVPLKLRPPGRAQPFEIRLTELEPGRRYRLTATIRPPLQLGINAVAAVLETGLKKIPTMVVPVNAFACERVSVTPPQLSVYEAQTRPGTRLLRVNYLKDHPIRVTKIECSIPALRANVLTNPPRSSLKTIFEGVTIRVAIPAWADLPDQGATVTIYTDDADPRFAKLVVPVEKRRPHRPTSRPIKLRRTGKVPARN